MRDYLLTFLVSLEGVHGFSSFPSTAPKVSPFIDIERVYRQGFYKKFVTSETRVAGSNESFSVLRDLLSESSFKAFHVGNAFITGACFDESNPNFIYQTYAYQPGHLSVYDVSNHEFVLMRPLAVRERVPWYLRYDRLVDVSDDDTVLFTLCPDDVVVAGNYLYITALLKYIADERYASPTGVSGTIRWGGLYRLPIDSLEDAPPELVIPLNISKTTFNAIAYDPETDVVVASTSDGGYGQSNMTYSEVLNLQRSRGVAMMADTAPTGVYPLPHTSWITGRVYQTTAASQERTGFKFADLTWDIDKFPTAEHRVRHADLHGMPFYLNGWMVAKGYIWSVASDQGHGRRDCDKCRSGSTECQITEEKCRGYSGHRPLVGMWISSTAFFLVRIKLDFSDYDIIKDVGWYSLGTRRIGDHAYSILENGELVRFLASGLADISLAREEVEHTFTVVYDVHEFEWKKMTGHDYGVPYTLSIQVLYNMVPIAAGGLANYATNGWSLTGNFYTMDNPDIKNSIDQLMVHPTTNQLWMHGVFPFYACFQGIYPEASQHQPS